MDTGAEGIFERVIGFLCICCSMRKLLTALPGFSLTQLNRFVLVRFGGNIILSNIFAPRHKKGIGKPSFDKDSDWFLRECEIRLVFDTRGCNKWEKNFCWNGTVQFCLMCANRREDKYTSKPVRVDCVGSVCVWVQHSHDVLEEDDRRVGRVLQNIDEK